MKVLYLAHSHHSGVNISYKYAVDVDQSLFDRLPYTYGISNVRVDGLNREVIATILVKTDLGKSQEEILDIYRAVVTAHADLDRLPKHDVTLRFTTVNLPSKTLPSEEQLVRMLGDVYTVNGVGGHAG